MAFFDNFLVTYLKWKLFSKKTLAALLTSTIREPIRPDPNALTWNAAAKINLRIIGG